MHALAFIRDGRFVTIVPRLSIVRGEGWDGTTLVLPEGAWRNELTGDSLLGGCHSLDDLLRRFPAALLARKAEVNVLQHGHDKTRDGNHRCNSLP